jgi:sRNA-binding carbon storage regulator CsrA
MDSKSLSDVIRETISSQNLTAYALGKMSGVSPVVIQRFLTGERGLTLTTAEKLAETLDLHLCRRDRGDLEPDAESQTSAPDEEGGPGRIVAKYEEITMKNGEFIHIGQHVKLMISNVTQRNVRINIHGPRDMIVVRGELWEALSGKSTAQRR